MFSLFSVFFSVQVLCIKAEKTISTTPTNDDEDDDSDEDDSLESDDAGRQYKNPRNSPSPLCPRDEDQATLLVRINTIYFYLSLYICIYVKLTRGQSKKTINKNGTKEKKN